MWRFSDNSWGDNKKANRDIWQDKQSLDDALSTLGDLIVKQRIRIVTIVEDDIKMFHELRGIETRAHEPELLALATAIRERANVFMTYDKDLLQGASRFKQKHKIKVRKPN